MSSTGAAGPGHLDVAAVLGWIAHRAPAGLAWLDGGAGARGLLAAEPDLELTGDDLGLLDEVHARWRADPARPWVGWLTYDLGAAALLGGTPRPGPLPGLCFRRYPGASWIDPSGLLRSVGDPGVARALWEAVAAAPPLAGGPWPLGPVRARLPEAEYRARVARAQEHIAAGETYQVNLSQAFDAPWAPGGPADLPARVAALYGRLRAAAPASMGALLATDAGFVVSNSPETLLSVELGRDGDRARTWPIKGTRPRSPDPQADARARAELLASAKDRAEHVMIVDLLRNDLGAVARAGSVRAASRPSVMSLPTVHHMVTEVDCVLRPGWTLRTLAEALFPGGSITGAPKRRTVEIIDALEGAARGIYCGAIVLLEPAGMRWSIPIRTGLADAAGLHLRAGGGVVIDSDPEQERVETVVKTLAFAPPA